MPKETINPDSLFNSLQYGFSQIVVSQGAKTVYLSGQVAWDEKGEIIGKGDLRTQTDAAFRNLERALSEAGAALKDVVSLRIYIVQSVMPQSKPVSEALKQFFPDSPPASTWIGVQGLANEDFLIEVEAVAVIE